MLKLYAFINRSKNKYRGEPLPFTIKYRGQDLTLNNSNNWLLRMIDKYLEKYLGVESVEEANNELESNYKKKSREQIKDFYFGLITMSVYTYMQFISHMRTEKYKITNEICNFILDYNRAIGIDMEKTNNDRDSITAIRTFIYNNIKKNGHRFEPNWDIYIADNIKFSPNNSDPEENIYW